MDDIEKKSSLHAEDYGAIWREFYCTALGTFENLLCYPNLRIDLFEVAAQSADASLEIYILRRNKFREISLKAFK